ncbi:MAG: hypothetical protein WED33_02345 [Bacteroidia bacterium]
MKSPGTRVFTFFSGILIGMLAAVGLVFLMMNQFNPFAFFNGETNTGRRDTVVDMRVLKKKPLPIQKKETIPVQPIFEEASDTITETEELVTEEIPEVKEEIVVMRDEFIGYLELPLLTIGDPLNTQQRDSLINELQGSPEKKKNFRIEFWKSPVNYRGYRLIGNKIMLFGMPNEKKISLYKYKGRLYLKNGVNTYKIVENEDFESFAKVIDESILNALKP